MTQRSQPRAACGGFLEEMAAAARARAERARRERPFATRPPARAPALAFSASLAEARGRGHVALVAEIKRASPSQGVIREKLDAGEQAARYERAGADALSVLTEPGYFRGSLVDLRGAVAASRLPTLRKDFIIDEIQVWEAADAGAAAVLLVVGLLDKASLRRLYDECLTLGLDALVEIHDEGELERAVDLHPTCIGVNSRDLRTLQVDLGAVERLAPLAPEHALLIAESGISSADDAKRAVAAGADALLVGEALVRTEDEPSLTALIKELQQATRKALPMGGSS
jgi:indole-3-glycerol phosphate synthase